MARVTKEEIETRVAQGAALLDDLDPTWYYNIDLSKLDLARATPTGTGCGCIVVQITGRPYYEGLYTLGLLPDSIWASAFEAGLPFGFTVDHIDDYDIAYWAWVEEVLDRRPSVLVGGEAER